MTVSRETETPKCSKCRVNSRRDGQRYCADCHAAYQKKWSKRNTKFSGAVRIINARLARMQP